MKVEKPIIGEIMEVIGTMETQYPELYGHLDEDPITLPLLSHPTMDEVVLRDYLKDLQQLLTRYGKTHGKVRSTPKK